MFLSYIVLSVIYVASLAIIDGLVNRLIFRNLVKKSYFSSEKKQIYKRPEWVMYCFLFLFLLPFALPITLSYMVGEIRYVLGYITILCIVDWDVIFGKIVFNDWFGDLPSARFPLIGWVHFDLWITILVRGIIALFCINALLSV